MNWVEIRAGLARTGPVKLVPAEDVDKYRGFRSVFCYPDPVADLIRDANSPKVARGEEVYCECVYFDFDQADGVPEFRDWLRVSDLVYTEWHSGGRSVHFHVPCTPIQGSWVPGAVRAWVKSVAPTADTSFLHASGLYRLPGTFHAKNPGSFKRQTAAGGSKLLTIAEPAPSPGPRWRAPQTAASDFWFGLTRSAGVGGRTAQVWLLAKMGAEAGIAQPTAAQEILAWNRTMTQTPLDEYSVLQQIDKAYSRTRRDHETAR